MSKSSGFGWKECEGKQFVVVFCFRLISLCIWIIYIIFQANYFLGKVAFHNNNYDDAIKLLTRAHEVAYNQKLAFGDEITNMLRQARREKFRIDEEKRLNEEIELQTYLNGLVDGDIDRRIAEYLDSSGDDKKEEDMEQIRAEGEEKRRQINNVFAQVCFNSLINIF